MAVAQCLIIVSLLNGHLCWLWLQVRLVLVAGSLLSSCHGIRSTGAELKEEVYLVQNQYFPFMTVSEHTHTLNKHTGGIHSCSTKEFCEISSIRWGEHSTNVNFVFSGVHFQH